MIFFTFMGSFKNFIEQQCDGGMFKIWLKSVEFKGIKNSLKDRWHFSSSCWTFDDDIDVPDWGWCPWWRYEWFAYSLRELCLKFGWNLFSLKASRTLSKIDDFAGGLEDAWRSWLGLMSLIMIGMCPWRSLESLFQKVAKDPYWTFFWCHQ